MRLLLPFWEHYSKKVRARIEKPLYAGFFTARAAEEKGMRLVTGREEGVCLYWLVDEADGVIADAKFQAFGPFALLAAAEILSELVLRKNYDQASRISADLLDHHLRDKKEVPAFPQKAFPFLNRIISALENAVHQCLDIPFAATYDTTPIEWDFPETSGGGMPGWEKLPSEEKIRLIETVIDREIRPYIELDAGGVQVVALRNECEVIISYQGSCTTCHSSTGSTLTAIQQILRARLHPSLLITPT